MTLLVAPLELVCRVQSQLGLDILRMEDTFIV